MPPRSAGSAPRRRLRSLPAVALLVAASLGCTEAEVWRDGVSLRPNGDVLVASDEIAVAQEVPGDVMTAGGSITFDGAVGGSYLGAGAEHL